MSQNLLTVDIAPEFFSGHPGAATLTSTPGSLISKLLPNVIVIAGVLCFLYILWGGWDMIIGAGKDGKPAEIEKAWNKITYGLVGFLIVATAYFILQIIQTATGVNFIAPPIT